MTIYLSKDFTPQAFKETVRVGGLLAFNQKATQGKLLVPDLALAIAAYNEEAQMIGGIAGTTFLASLEVEVLWVAAAYRGQGVAARLLKALEADAREAGCQLAHLTTYSFQAPAFYQKQGYQICGEISGFPDGITLLTLKKTL